MNKILLAGATALSLSFAVGAAHAADDIYADFPVTVSGYTGSKTTSVSYTGQIARQTLHDSLKKLAGGGNGSANADLLATLTAYFEEKFEGRAIIAPADKGPFVFLQTMVDDISGGKNLAGKTFKGIVTGMPNGMTGPELISFWLEKAAEADGGVDFANGYNYPQLISKFIMGAVFYNQAVDNYLDEKLTAENKPNNLPYKDGAAYTGKEHSWDEAFGYFGAPAHTLTLTAAQVYEIAKLGSKSDSPEETFALADYNGDGKIDMRTEMVFGPAYYAAAFDRSTAGKDNETAYLHTIMQAFLDGRKLITAANGEALTDDQRSELQGYAAVIEENWEQVLAEAVFKYAGSVYKDLAKLRAALDAGDDIDGALKKYIKHWGELKGFSLSLQAGRENLGETATRLNRMIGFGPLLPNASQVVDIDRNGNYIRDQGAEIGEYMLHMLKVQKLMVEQFDVQARNNDALGDLANLTEQLGTGDSAEND